MIRTLMRFWAPAVAAVMFPAPSLAFEFSGERILKDHGKHIVAGVRARDDRWRLEYAVPQDGAMAVIIRQDQRLAWLILSKRQAFVQVPIVPEHQLWVTEKLEGEVNRDLIGTEDLNGYPAELFEVTTIVNGKRAHYYQWVTKAERFVMKMVRKEGDWSLEYRNVKFLPQSFRFFEPPYGFSDLRSNSSPSQ
jgi:hypothetical protein